MRPMILLLLLAACQSGIQNDRERVLNDTLDQCDSNFLKILDSKTEGMRINFDFDSQIQAFRDYVHGNCRPVLKETILLQCGSGADMTMLQYNDCMNKAIEDGARVLLVRGLYRYGARNSRKFYEQILTTQGWWETNE